MEMSSLPIHSFIVGRERESIHGTKHKCLILDQPNNSGDSVVGIVARLRAGPYGIRNPIGARIFFFFFFAKSSRPAFKALLSSMNCTYSTLSVASLAPQHFSTLSHKRYDLQEKITEQKMCFNFLCNFYLKHFTFYEEFSKTLSKM
jgi:hypothetical protein